ncbi:M50 family metallopeptidase [Nannocystaceae bacterium ST9]
MASYDDIKGRVQARDGANVSKRIRYFLLGSLAFTLLVYIAPSPWGLLAGLPLIWLSTLVHELGHGLTAAMVGGYFEKFVMFPDASGAASYSGFLGPGRLALIAAGGLVGPAIVAAFGFMAARRANVAKISLLIGAVALVLLTILVVRNGFGVGFTLTLAALLLLLGTRKNPEVAQVAMVFFATQLAAAVFSRSDYLFTEYAETAIGQMPSDVAQMADALVGPYWLWGGVCAAFSLLVMGIGLWVFFRGFTRPGWLRRKPKAK